MSSAVGDLHERVFENYNIWATKMGAHPGQQQDVSAAATTPDGACAPRCVYSVRHDPDGPAITKARKAARRQAATEHAAALARTYGVIGGASHVRSSSSSSSSSSFSAQSAPALQQQPAAPQPPARSATAAAGSSAAGTGIASSSSSPLPAGGADASGAATVAGTNRPASASPASQNAAAAPDAPPPADASHTVTPTKRLGADTIAVPVPVHVLVSSMAGSDTTTRLTDLALWYCIRAEAANLRFMPE